MNLNRGMNLDLEGSVLPLKTVPALWVSQRGPLLASLRTSLQASLQDSLMDSLRRKEDE